MMAEALLFGSQDKSKCLMCSGPLINPHQMPCGHSLCESCFNSDQRQNPGCPLCNKTYTLMADPQRMEEVYCDCCAEPKMTAVKFCPICTHSYCETHVKLHYELEDLKTHLLMNFCPTHVEVLNVYCKTDDISICRSCTLQEHKEHVWEELGTEREEELKQLGDIRSKIGKRVVEMNND
uniref:RING-type domain-containing protein n=1 Tax=Erpetoichthys calabaricus TaxID=27687 RepID=A0A8C4T6X3_ERPCA